MGIFLARYPDPEDIENVIIVDALSGRNTVLREIPAFGAGVNLQAVRSGGPGQVMHELSYLGVDLLLRQRLILRPKLSETSRGGAVAVEQTHHDVVTMAPDFLHQFVESTLVVSKIRCSAYKDWIIPPDDPLSTNSVRKLFKGLNTKLQIRHMRFQSPRIAGESVVEVIAVPEAIQLLKVRHHWPRVPGPKHYEVNLFRLEVNHGCLPRVEWVYPKAEPIPNSIYEPLCIKSWNIRTPAGTNDHCFSKVSPGAHTAPSASSDVAEILRQVLAG